MVTGARVAPAHCRILGLLLERQPRLFRRLLDACITIQSQWRGFKVGRREADSTWCSSNLRKAAVSDVLLTATWLWSRTGTTAGESCQGNHWAAGAQAASCKAEQAAAGCGLCIHQRSYEQHKAPDTCR